MHSEPVIIVKFNPDRVMQDPDKKQRSLESPWKGLFHNNDQVAVLYVAYYTATY